VCVCVLCVGLAGKWRCRTKPIRRLSGWSIHCCSRRTSDCQDGKNAVGLWQTSTVSWDGSQSASLLLHAGWPRSSVWTVQEIHSPCTSRCLTLPPTYLLTYLLTYSVTACCLCSVLSAYVTFSNSSNSCHLFYVIITSGIPSDHTVILLHTHRKKSRVFSSSYEEHAVVTAADLTESNRLLKEPLSARRVSHFSRN